MKATAEANLRSLGTNPYPGRGIVLGQSPDAGSYVQIYWIMGRSENSRNRVFVAEDGFVKTRAFDESKVTNPSLIIYYPVKHFGKAHIVTNGDQTDTILEALKRGETFENALYTREFEPDPPHYTPRISGITNMGDADHVCKLSLLKSVAGSPECCTRQFFNFSKAVPGFGHCIHTYDGDGEPLPPFSGEPYAVELFDEIERTAQTYWELLNADNRVSLLVKFIGRETGKTDLRIRNKLS